MNPNWIRQHCRFCHGRGCLNCDTLINAEYKRQFPDGPQPLVTLQLNDPEEAQLLPQLMQGIAEAATPEDVMKQIHANADIITRIQDHLASHDREDQP
jgi:hypothetical protein